MAEKTIKQLVVPGSSDIHIFDATYLNGQAASYYTNYNNLTNKPTIPTVNNGTLTIQKDGSTVATFTANSSSNVTANITMPTSLRNPNALTVNVNGTSTTYDGSAAKSITINAAALGLSGAMRFLGISATAISDGATTNPITINTTSTTVEAGNVVLYGSKEFVWTGSIWEELGDEGSHALKSVQIIAGSGLTGGGTLEANRTLNVGAGDGITVSADAVAHAVPSGAAASTKGSSTARYYIKTITTDKFGHITGITTGNETVVDTNTAHVHTAGNGLSISGSGGTSGTTTYSAKAGSGITVDSSGINVNTGYTTSGKNYKVAVDSTSGGLYVNVPWTDTNTTYSIATASTAGLVKPISVITKPTINTTTTTSGRYYSVQMSSDGNMFVNVPWTDTNTNTTYSAGTGLSLSGTTFNHSNSITAGTVSEGGSARTLGFGGTFKIPSITYDAQGHIKSVGTTTLTMPANPNTDTHYTTHLYVGASGTASNAATSNGATYLKLYDNSTARESHLIQGSGATTVSSDANGNITINSTNTNTTNTAGATDTDSKIFLIGATSQSAAPQTYSHNTAYVGTDGCLYSGGRKVANMVEWNAVVKGATYSRLCHVAYNVNIEGCSYLISISATRSNVVYNDTYIVKNHHSAKGKIVKISGSDYSTGLKVRTLSDSGGDSYFELYDNANSITSSTTQTVHCRLLPIFTGTITTYTSFTDGTTLPSGYSVGEELTTTNAELQATLNWSDILSKPTIGSGTLTIQKNGSSVGSFSANSTSNVTANITVPTKVSELTNDSGYLTSHQSLDGYLPLSGGTMTGQLKTSFKSSVATGSYGSTVNSIDDLIAEVRFSSGCMGSLELKDSDNNHGVDSGWYNFLYIPHRSGGVNGAASGDNCNYGTLLLWGMTVGGTTFWRIRIASGGTVGEIQKVIESGTYNSHKHAVNVNTTSVASSGHTHSYTKATGVTVSTTTTSNSYPVVTAVTHPVYTSSSKTVLTSLALMNTPSITTKYLSGSLSTSTVASGAPSGGTSVANSTHTHSTGSPSSTVTGVNASFSAGVLSLTTITAASGTHTHTASATSDTVTVASNTHTHNYVKGTGVSITTTTTSNSYPVVTAVTQPVYGANTTSVVGSISNSTAASTTTKYLTGSLSTFNTNTGTPSGTTTVATGISSVGTPS